MKYTALTISVLFISTLVGCSSISRSLDKANINNKLNENGVYYREAISDDKKYKLITKFRLDKKEKMLSYLFQTFDMQGNLNDEVSYNEGYYLSCPRSGCKIGYSRRFNSGIGSYVIRLDDSGIPYIYESGNIYKFDFMPD